MQTCSPDTPPSRTELASVRSHCRQLKHWVSTASTRAEPSAAAFAGKPLNCELSAEQRRRMPPAGQNTPCPPSPHTRQQQQRRDLLYPSVDTHTLCPSRALWMSSLISSNTPAWSVVGPNTLSNVKECLAGAWPVRLPGTVMSRARPSSSPAKTRQG